MSDRRRPPSQHAALGGSLRDFRNMRGPNLLDRCEDFFAWQDARRASGVWPYARSTESGPATTCAIRDDRGNLQTGVNFASQDYLSLSSHPAIAKAAREAVDAMGVHSAGSSALLGNTSMSVTLEAKLADVLQMEEAVLFPTGWAAGYGAIKGLVRSNDYVVLDELAHDCLQHGSRASTQNVMPFRHLSLDDCNRKLATIRAKAPQAGILLITEGLFSMNSDTPDIAAMQTLAHEHGATLMVDVAHDFGNLGPDGTGHIGLQGMLGQVDLVMGSFSKTFASNGGFVATNRAAVKEYIRYYAPSCTFSNALSPVQAAIIGKALDIVRSAEGATLRQMLRNNVLALREDVCERGFSLYGEPSAIVAVRAGDEAIARLTACELPELGLLANLVEFPAVARGQSRFRLQVMAGHSQAEIEAAVEALAEGTERARNMLSALTLRRLAG